MTTYPSTDALPDLLTDSGVLQSFVRDADDALILLAPDGTVVYANDATSDLWGYAPASLTGGPVASLLPGTEAGEGYDRLRALARDPDDVEWGDGELTLEDADGEAVHAFVDLHDVAEADGDYLLARWRDITTRRRRERTLERLERVDALVRDVTQAVIDADDRGTVEETACEQLVATDPHVFAWFGRPRLTSADVEPVAWAAGNARASNYLDVVEVTTDDTATGQGPTGRALRTKSVVTVDDVDTDPRFSPWAGTAREHGFRSSAAVPVATGDTVYGALSVYADEAHAFDEVTDALAELGRLVASAIEASEQRKLLYADRVLELELRVTDTGGLIGATAALDCTLTLEGFVPDDPAVLYVDVDGVDPQRLLDHAGDALEHGRVVHTHEERAGGLVEAALADGDIVATLADAGARVQSAVVASGDGHFVVRAAPDADVRGIVDHVRRIHPNADLVSKREVDRQRRPFTDVRGEVHDRLTDRQHTALQTAYYAGYLRWPRESSGEDVAETMGVSPPTFYQHFRAGERKLFDAFFGE
ncbi:bacterio-opsin activator domain-containing protein [Halarchaeum sp. P4]|uniref:bacterio-opsin activator domain-containing protein n=1 Tax=Halarchaeum sp. P4 TaxID=3421639 RepID=UPI003EBBB690